MTSSDLEVNITIAEPYLSRLSDVAQQLEQAGLTITHVLPNLDIICGTVPASRIDDLRQVSGVTDVEVAGSCRIAPPNADIQ